MTDITEIIRFRSASAPLALRWPTRRSWSGRASCPCGCAGADGAAAFLWLVQSLRPEDTIFSDAVLFTPTLENYRALWQGNFAGSSSTVWR